MMPRLRPILSLVAIAVACAAVPAAAQAANFDPGGFRFSSDSFTVHENAGQAVITVVRGDASKPATAYYVAVGIGHQCGAANCNATPPGNGDVPADFGGTNGALAFQAGQTSGSFTVPIVDHHFDTIPKTFQVAIFNAWNQGVADPSKAVVTIINDDPTPARDPNNPLMLPVAPTNGNPLSGARFFVDHDAEPAVAARQFPAINVIASQPGTARFGAFSGPDVGLMVNRFLVRASVQEPGTVPMLATYRIVDGHCGSYTAPPSAVAGYHDFISRFAQGIGSYPAVLYLEMDSLITTPCLSGQGLNVRMAELHDAINVLTATCPHLVIYLDAGAGDAIPAGQTAHLLRQAGISQIEGFFLNSTHFDWTSNEIRFGEQVSALTGGKHFVVNTGDNGRGPLTPPDPVRQGNEVLCNPAGRGLGPKPTASTGFPNVDAFAWTTNPGESGGACVPGAPPTGAYWPAYALMLIRNANFAVDNHAATGSAARAHHKKTHKKRKHVRHTKHKRKHRPIVLRRHSHKRHGTVKRKPVYARMA
jgi:endoglucanase